MKPGLPQCGAPGHLGSRRNTIARRFHELKPDSDFLFEGEEDQVGRIIPFCSDCVETHAHETSPWTPDVLDTFFVQEVMES